jgi:iron complex outermembrane receptor protein
MVWQCRRRHLAAGVSSLAFSLNAKLAKNLALAFDATNLLDFVRAQYRYSEEEPRKIDVSAR